MEIIIEDNKNSFQNILIIKKAHFTIGWKMKLNSMLFFIIHT